MNNKKRHSEMSLLKNIKLIGEVMPPQFKLVISKRAMIL